MSPIKSGFVLLLLIVVAETTIFTNDDKVMTRDYNPYGLYITEIDKLKRSFGRNCMFAITGCFTSSQAERYRKYLENVRFIPK